MKNLIKKIQKNLKDFKRETECYLKDRSFDFFNKKETENYIEQVLNGDCVGDTDFENSMWEAGYISGQEEIIGEILSYKEKEKEKEKEFEKERVYYRNLIAEMWDIIKNDGLEDAVFFTEENKKKFKKEFKQ